MLIIDIILISINLHSNTQPFLDRFLLIVSAPVHGQLMTIADSLCPFVSSVFPVQGL